MNILNLPDWTILHIAEGSHDYEISASYDVPALVCVSCQRIGVLQRFGRRRQLFLDLPMHGKRVGIYVEHPWYRCTQCPTWTTDGR